MAMINTVIELTPIPKERPKFRRVGQGVIAYTPKKTREYESEIRRLSSDLWPELITGPVFMQLMFWLPIPASWSKKNRQLAIDGVILPTKKPDFDNLLKAVLDGLIPSKGDPSNRGLLKDDSIITDFGTRKRYSATPSIKVVIKTMDDYLPAP